jgi:uncharacterized protein
VRRLPEKQSGDRAALHALLDAALVAHVCVIDGGQPYVLPVAVARDGDRLIIHGSNASRLFRLLGEGAPTCLTVTILDGVVVARSAFESSMQYRSAMVLGTCRALEGEEKAVALAHLTERLLPGRGDDARPASAKELAATTVLVLPLEEWSLKIADGAPDDAPADLDRPVWAGVVPIEHRFGQPVAAPDLRFEVPVPDYLTTWPKGRS